MEYVYGYLVFLAQAVTVVVAFLIILSAVASLAMKSQQMDEGGALHVTKLNDRVRELRHTMEANVLPAGLVKKQHKAEAKAENKANKAQVQAMKSALRETTSEAPAIANDVENGNAGHEDDGHAERVFFLHFEGDTRASGVDKLRREINAILTLATKDDEVVISIESPGGMVSNYGLAASQLARFREREIPMTVVVDKVAASGGYLMAVVANRIVAAPFALLGSIGVVAQVPNVNRLLKKNDVDVEVLTAGKHKRTLTLLGENTEEGRQKFLEELEDVHALFQEFVANYRPEMDLEAVATGEAWFGKRALEMKLVDELATSDEIVLKACERSEVYAIAWEEQKKPLDRIMGRVNGVLQQAEDVLARFSGRP
ncbi:MAG: protease SohB [Pseudomonadales bacterium]|nr:protease SohB [Pseudomonadales bacterium]